MSIIYYYVIARTQGVDILNNKMGEGLGPRVRQRG